MFIITNMSDFVGLPDDPFVAKIASMFRLVVYPPDEFIYAEVTQIITDYLITNSFEQICNN